MAERKAERVARRKAGAETFEALASCYLEEHAKRRKRLRGWQEDERKLQVEVLPVWGSRLAAEIRRADVRDLLERIVAERGGVCANRTRALVSKVFSFGIERERVESNPVYGVKRLYTEKPRERVFTEGSLALCGLCSIASSRRSPQLGALSSSPPNGRGRCSLCAGGTLSETPLGGGGISRPS